MPSDIKEQRENAGAAFGGGDRGGDRDKLRLPEEQIALIRAVAAANPNTVAVIVSGSAIISTDWAAQVGAILQSFYSGMEGGTALARLLYGDVSPSGKLPFTVARNESDYPSFDRNADTITYGHWHGYTLMERAQTAVQFCFGHGLSYTRFRYRGFKARRMPGGIEAYISIHNEGDRRADEIAQLYVGFPGVVVEQPRKLLRGFQRMSIRPGETATLRFFVPDQDLTYWDEASRDWRIEPGDYAIYVGGNSADADTRAVLIRI